MSYDVTLTTTNTPPTALLSHTEWIRGLARSLVRDAAAADDLTQDTLLAALRGQPRDPARLRPWLAGIARNLARKEQRKGRLRGDREADRALDALKDQDPSHFRATSQAATLARAEAHRSLVEHVLAMPEPARTLLLQRYFEGRKPAEIASLQGISPAAVHAGLTRAHGALRKKLEGEGDKQEWLATVGLLLLPLAGREAAAAAIGSAAGSAAGVGSATGSVSKPFWGSAWGLGSGVGALVAVAVAVTIISLSGGESDDVLTDEKSAPESTSMADAVEPVRVAIPVKAVGIEEQAVAATDSTLASARGEEVDLPEDVTDDAPSTPTAPTYSQFGGRYVNVDGRPIANMDLGLVRAVDGRPEFWTKSTAQRLVGHATTDANGMFSFAPTEIGTFVVGPIPTDPGATAWLSPVEFTLEAQSVTADIQALGDHWIEGRINFAGGFNSEEIELVAFRSDVVVQAVTTCNIDGSFRFGPLAPGSYTVSSIGESEVPWAVVATAVEATQTRAPEAGPTALVTPAPLVLHAITARRLSGTIDFARDGGDNSKEGMIRIGVFKQEGGQDAHEWIAQAGVRSDGAYAVKGIEPGFYFISYESRDGRHVAFNPLGIHDEDEHSASEAAEFATIRKALADVDQLQKASKAVPAVVAWISSGALKDRGDLTVGYRLKKLGDIPVTEGFPMLRYPMGPSGSVRVMVPMKSSKLELLGSNDHVLGEWTTIEQKQGAVLLLEP